MVTHSSLALADYIISDSSFDWSNQCIPTCQISHYSPALEANSYYFGHPEWAKNYFDACHRDDAFKSRWLATTGSWDDKIVVDIGCGPGNVYATVVSHCSKIVWSQSRFTSSSTFPNVRC